MKKLATIFGLLMMMVLVTSFTSSNDIGKGVSGGQETRNPYNYSSVSNDIGKGVSGGQETRNPYNYSSVSNDIGKGVSGGQETR